MTHVLTETERSPGQHACRASAAKLGRHRTRLVPGDGVLPEIMIDFKGLTPG